MSTTLYQDNVARFATTRESRQRELDTIAANRKRDIEEAFADFDRALRNARHADDPRAAVEQACADVAGRLGGLGVWR